MWILDTDHLSVLDYAGSPAAERLRTKLLRLATEDYGTTIINYEEQCRGWLEVIKQAKSIAGQVTAYQRLHRQLRSYCKSRILDFDESAAIEFQRLRAAKVRIPTTDLKIASIVLSLSGATLLTRNARDFMKVPNLRFEDWTKE